MGRYAPGIVSLCVARLVLTLVLLPLALREKLRGDGILGLGLNSSFLQLCLIPLAIFQPAARGSTDLKGRWSEWGIMTGTVPLGWPS